MHAYTDLRASVSEASSGTVHDASTTTKYNIWSMNIPVNYSDGKVITISV